MIFLTNLILKVAIKNIVG